MYRGLMHRATLLHHAPAGRRHHLLNAVHFAEIALRLRMAASKRVSACMCAASKLIGSSSSRRASRVATAPRAERHLLR